MSQKNKPKIILVLGGYGTFGRRITTALCRSGHHLIINGRTQNKADNLRKIITENQPDAAVSVACFDIFKDLNTQLELLQPNLVIHCCGPFQGQDTNIANNIIKSGVDYIDLSDGRDFVQSMLSLDPLAKANDVVAITAASTVPALSSAVLTHLQNKFQIKKFNTIQIGISPGQKTSRGLATTQAVLSYIGKPLKPWPGLKTIRYGWQNTYLQAYPNIRNRLMSNCEAADLDCLHHHFPINQLYFSAGMESKLLHLLISICAWLIRFKIPLKPEKYAKNLLTISRWFDPLGTSDGGMHVKVNAININNQAIDKTWFIEAFDNDGPQIPAVPAIVVANKILNNELSTGVQACINTLSLDEYLGALDQYSVTTEIQ